MDQEPLVIEQIDAGATFLRELAKSIAVSAAFWLKVSEDSPWYLHVVSQELNDQNLGTVYGEVLRIAGEMRIRSCILRRLKLMAWPFYVGHPHATERI